MYYKYSFIQTYRLLYALLRDKWSVAQVEQLRQLITQYITAEEAIEERQARFDVLATDMRIAVTAIEEMSLKQAEVSAILLFYPVFHHLISLSQVEKMYGKEVSDMLSGLLKINTFSNKKTAVKSDNYVKLLLSIAQDIRVVFIKIAQHVQLMREARWMNQASRLEIAVESQYLYAPLAHRMGLYAIKSELEDLSLKYTDRATYDFVAQKINETKRSRDAYIDNFIAPIKERLDKTGLHYDIKGRTKSIHSINNKLKKQKIEFENIYDLFAIRIILDSPLEMEKAHCWQAYSIVTDMYQPNPKRLKDWLSIPKSNGYESLHITVMGPDAKWVEVQIRTRRMDEIAEKGFAAHWRYKGVKGEAGLDAWLTSLRESLEAADTDVSEKLGDFKLDLYDEEIFVFTPNGDLFKLPKGATILDFAFAIHSKVGATCVSGKVNGKNVPIKYVLNSGDQVEVITSSHQSPKQNWLSVVVTAKARTRIRQLLKEEAGKHADIAKEMLFRRTKNRKIDLDDAVLMQLIKKLRYKSVTEFYVDISSGKLDVNWVIDSYLELEQKEADAKEMPVVAAESFVLKPTTSRPSADELVIDKNLTGVDYTLAKCCNPIFGDEIFGFVSSQGIKIHRTNCTNAPNLFSRFGYRVLKARWSGTSGTSSYTIVLKIVGNDQINIVSNLSSIISKEEGVQMRSINIDSNDGLFQGNIAVMLSDTSKLEQLIKKLRIVKGVKSVERIN